MYAEVIDPIRPDMLHKPSADALNTVGNNSAVIRYAKKKAMVVKNFPPIAKVMVNQLRAVIKSIQTLCWMFMRASSTICKCGILNFPTMSFFFFCSNIDEECHLEICHNT